MVLLVHVGNQMEKGINVVQKNKKEEWNNRLETLTKTIEYWLCFETNKMIEIIELFYDSN